MRVKRLAILFLLCPYMCLAQEATAVGPAFVRRDSANHASMSALAASSVVVADATTHEPVSHASLYTKEGGRFHSCISNEAGIARVNFQFQRLTVSHLNYERRVVRRLSDTIFLEPRFLTKAEVVITNREPEWIRRCLKQVIKQKEKNYFSHTGCESFVYDTQSMGTNKIYRFHLGGLLRMKDQSHDLYAIAVDTAHIIASDSTTLTDVINLRRMLYEDFVMDLDNGFLRTHRFYHNPDYQGSKASEVELRFRSKKNTDDRGWLVMDTVSCTILSAYRFTGTKTNLKERISGLMYSLSRMYGYRIDKWTRDYRVTYAQRPDGTLYPAEVRYKVYYSGLDGDLTEDQKEFHEYTGGGFPNMEATLTLRPDNQRTERLIPPTTSLPDSPHDGEATAQTDDPWKYLLKSWYIRFSSETIRQQEKELSNLPATFTIF